MSVSTAHLQVDSTSHLRGTIYISRLTPSFHHTASVGHGDPSRSTAPREAAAIFHNRAFHVNDVTQTLLSPVASVLCPRPEESAP